MRALRFLIGAAVVLWLAVASSAASAQAPAILRVQITQPITPVIADHLTAAVAEAERQGYVGLLVELDTPGGLDTSMRQIVQSFLSARIPVIVYVAPPGARAASAGSIITSAAHIAAMSPGTTIGAATPVNLESGESASDKVVNDAVAYAKSIAAQRGRSTEFAEDSVRDGRAIPADEAVQIGAVDLIAADQESLLRAIDGRTVDVPGGQVALHTANVAVVDYEMSIARQILQLIADPNLAFLFLSLGTLAVIYEFANPGTGLGGIIGAILLILGFFALSVLPVNVAGLALLALAAALFIAEVFAPGIGVFAAGGTISLLMAGLFLFEGQVRVSPAVLLPTAAVIGIGVLIAGRLTWRARRAQPASGREAMVGIELVMRSARDNTGLVHYGGSWWNARSDTAPLAVDQRVRIIGLDGLTLLVEPADSPEGAAESERKSHE